MIIFDQTKLDIAQEWWWFTLIVATLPLGAVAAWWWNEFWYVRPIKRGLINSGKKLPPGHLGLPFVGELITFLWYFKILRRPDDFINSKRNKYGDGVGMYRTFVFGKPSIIACTSASSKFVLHADEAFCLHRWPTNDLVGHHSIISALGPSHRRLRNFLSEAINMPQALQRIALLNQPRIAASLQSWAEKGTVIAYNEVKKMTFESISKIFISFEAGPLLDEMDRYFHGLLQGFRANPVNFPGTAYYYALKCRRKLEEIFRKEVNRRKEEQKNGIGRSNDLMDGLMEMKDENEERLTDDEVVDNITSLVIGGYESISTSSMWAIYYLAKFPSVLQRLREENIAISQKKNGDYITKDDISQMVFTRKVVEETLRLANVSAFVFRRSDRDVEFQGHIIPKGWRVICWLRYIHTNPCNFDDPMCFNPDRWDNPAKPGVFQIFGGGSRICTGNMFARMQLTIFLHQLSKGYKWELVNPSARINYLPLPKPVDGVKIRMTKI